MKLILFAPFFVLLLLGSACSDKTEKLKRLGFQIYDEYRIAVKCPCQLESTVTKNVVKGTDQESYACDLLSEEYEGIAEARYSLDLMKSKNERDKPAEITKSEVLEFLENERYESKGIKIGKVDAIRYHYSEYSEGVQIFIGNGNSAFLIIEGNDALDKMDKWLEDIAFL